MRQPKLLPQNSQMHQPKLLPQNSHMRQSKLLPQNSHMRQPKFLSQNSQMRQPKVLPLRPLFHVSVSVLISTHTSVRGPVKIEQFEQRWGYSCRPYQYPHRLIRKQHLYKMVQWAILSGCGRHTDIIWQNQGIKNILTGRFSPLLPNCLYNPS